MSSKVLVGVSDWRYGDRWAAFYPAGMPEEWQLAYFNTQFDCVWLSRAAWTAESKDKIEEWVADTREEFRFVLESAAEDGGLNAHLLKAFAPRLGKHCPAADEAIIWFEAGVNLRQLASELQKKTAELPTIYLISRDGNLATLEKVRELRGVLGFGS